MICCDVTSVQLGFDQVSHDGNLPTDKMNEEPVSQVAPLQLARLFVVVSPSGCCLFAWISPLRPEQPC